MPIIAHHVRGVVVTMIGSFVAVAMAMVDVVQPRAIALVGQISPPSPAIVSAIGIAAGLVTAVGGIVIQVFDRANTRRRADQAHLLQIYYVRRGCDELAKYCKEAYQYIVDIREACIAAGIHLPPDPGPPPDLPRCGPNGYDDNNISGSQSSSS